MTAERNIVTSLLLVIISSLIACVEVNLAMFTVHFSHYKRRLDILMLKESAFLLSFLFGFCPECDISK